MDPDMLCCRFVEHQVIQRVKRLYVVVLCVGSVAGHLAQEVYLLLSTPQTKRRRSKQGLKTSSRISQKRKQRHD